MEKILLICIGFSLLFYFSFQNVNKWQVKGLGFSLLIFVYL